MSQAWYDYPALDFNAYQTQDLGGDTPHYAYDLQTPFHTVLTAPTSGTVKIADYKDWGGEIFVQPDDSSLPEWYMYHPDELDVVAGQHIEAGQQIGLSGGENPGYPGAEHPASPKWSSGAHTHVGWFTGWKQVSRGRTIPYGPDTASLIELAKKEPLTTVPGVSPMATNSNNPLGINLPSGQQAGVFIAGIAAILIGGAILVESLSSGTIARKMVL